MTIEVVTIGLFVFIVAQQGFYMWQLQKLVNKLMSKDFYSYNQTVNPPKPLGFKVDVSDVGPDPVKELNRQFGL